MTTATAKKPKITAQLLQDYKDAQAQRLEYDRLAKPFADKEKQLAKDIQAALEAAEVTTKKAGAWRANLIEKPGLVSWKDLCVTRLEAGELEKIQAELPPRFSIDVQPA